DRVIAVIDDHVARHAVVEKHHPELVVWYIGLGIGREKSEPNTPAGPLEERVELRRGAVGGRFGGDESRNLNRILLGRSVEHLARNEGRSGPRSVDQQARVRAREQDTGRQLYGFRTRL